MLRRTLYMARSTNTGFTLIEMLVVLAVLSLVVALVFPRLPSTDATNLRSSARSLAATIRYLNDQSVTARKPYRLHLNVADNTITITEKAADGSEKPPEESFAAKRILAEGITLQDVEIPRLGKINAGEVVLDFATGGLTDFTVIHLQSAANSHFTVIAYPRTGKVKVLEGYQEAAR